MNKYNIFATVLFRLFLPIIVLSYGCTTATTKQRSMGSEIDPTSSYMRVSPEADQVYSLHSNKERTHFWVDSQEVAVGRRVKIKIDNKAHTVVAQPEGCVAKEEFIQPPYHELSPLSFTFLMGECQAAPLISDSRTANTVETSDRSKTHSTVSIFPPTTIVSEVKPDSPSDSPNDGATLPKYINGKRTALLIGNSSYSDNPLENPINDVTDLKQKLTELGFEVLLYTDADQLQIEDGIRDFGKRLMINGGIGLFFYAGHGIQMDGHNYIIPINHNVQAQKDLKYKAVDVQQVLDEMESASNPLNIVILDACRDNPLPRSFVRSGSRGFARMDGSTGTIIAFSTSPGETASDGSGRNGTYTKHLLMNIGTKGVPIEGVFKLVMRGVKQETRNKQIPWVSTSFPDEFYFAGK